MCFQLTGRSCFPVVQNMGGLVVLYNIWPVHVLGSGCFIEIPAVIACSRPQCLAPYHNLCPVYWHVMVIFGGEEMRFLTRPYAASAKVPLGITIDLFHFNCSADNAQE